MLGLQPAVIFSFEFVDSVCSIIGALQAMALFADTPIDTAVNIPSPRRNGLLDR